MPLGLLPPRQQSRPQQQHPRNRLLLQQRYTDLPVGTLLRLRRQHSLVVFLLLWQRYADLSAGTLTWVTQSILPRHFHRSHFYDAYRRLKQTRVRRSSGATGLASMMNLRDFLTFEPGRGRRNAPTCPERPPTFVMSRLFPSTVYCAKGVCARLSLELMKGRLVLRPTVRQADHRRE